MKIFYYSFLAALVLFAIFLLGDFACGDAEPAIKVPINSCVFVPRKTSETIIYDGDGGYTVYSDDTPAHYDLYFSLNGGTWSLPVEPTSWLRRHDQDSITIQRKISKYLKLKGQYSILPEEHP